MLSLSFSFLALICAIGLVSCQFDTDRERELLERERAERERNFGRVRLAEGCSGKVMDIFFLMDSSSSIYINDYMSQHRLVRDIISKFDVSVESTRVGMLTFSDDLERPVIGLNRYSTKNELLNSISVQMLPYRTGVTNTDLAIRHVRQLSDFRQDITKVMVVMTDGGSRSPGSTAREAELARNAGFYLFVVGIGQYIEEREWRSIASDPDESFVYNITSPRFLEDVKFSLPPRACALPPIILGGSCDVNEMAEVFFVAGRSASERAMDFLESFNRRSRDNRDLLRVNYMVDGCAPINNVGLVEAEPFLCERFDPRTGDVVNPVGVVEMLTRVSRSIMSARNNRGDTNQVVVLFLDDETMSASRFDLANMARSLVNLDETTVVVADLGIRTYRDFAQRLVTSRNNIVSFSGGSLAGQSMRNLLNSVCVAVNNNLDPDFQSQPR